MIIFLTGASGFVGSEILRQAVDQGHDVVALVRSEGTPYRIKALENRFTQVRLDVGNPNSLDQLLSRYRPEIIIHSAWSGVSNSARDDLTQIYSNVEFTCKLMVAAGNSGVMCFIGLGSQGEYGAGSDMKEDSIPEPTTLYGAAKVSALYLSRQLASQYGMRHAWLRLFSTYGPMDNDGWLIPTMIKDMLAGKRPKTTAGEQYWDWLYIRDVASGVMAIVNEEKAFGIFNLGSGKPLKVRNVIEKIRDLCNPDMELIFGEIEYRHDQVMYMQADISKLKMLTNWHPLIGIDEGLAATVEWHRRKNI